jgi:hypothetical protein
MQGKLLEFKTPAPVSQKIMADSPAGARLADAILQQFLVEADAPARKLGASARIFTFNHGARRGPLRVGDQVLLRLTSPFTSAFWLS